MMPDILIDALGGTFAYEEGLGDYRGAQRAVAELPAGEFETRLGGAVIDLLRGEVTRAEAGLAEASQAAGDQPERLLRVASWQLLAQAERFNTFPDGAGAGAVEISARWHPTEAMRELDARWHALRARATESEALTEAWLVYEVLWRLKPVRSLLQSWRYGPPTPNAEGILRGAADDLRQVLSRRRTNPRATRVSAMFSILALADLCRRAGEADEAGRVLSLATLEAEDGGYARTMATMLEADGEAAPSGTPMAWNLALQDSSTEGGALAAPVEAAEFQVPSEEVLAGAARVYEEAEREFHEAGVPRAAAMAALRRGYVEAVRGGFAAAEGHAARAEALFERAGDGRGLALAWGHRAMACLGSGKREEAIGLAVRVGTWGRASGSFGYALGVGILLNRWARHWLVRRADFERALAGIGIAQACYRALGAEINAAQSVVDQGLVHQAVGDSAVALTFFEEGLDAYERLGESFPLVADNLVQRQVMLGVKTFNLAQNRLDSDAMERTGRRLEGRMRTVPGPADGIRHRRGAGPGVGADVGRGTRAGRGAGGAPVAGIAGPHGGGPGARPGSALPARAGPGTTGIPKPGGGTWPRPSVPSPPSIPRAGLFSRRPSWASRSGGRKRRRLSASIWVGAKRTRDRSTTSSLCSARWEAGKARPNWPCTGDARRSRASWPSYAPAPTGEAKSYWDQLVALDGPEWWRTDERPWLVLGDAGEMCDALGDASGALGHFEAALREFEARRTRLSRDELRTALAADKGTQWLYFLATRAAGRAGDPVRAFHIAERGKARSLLDLMAEGGGGFRFGRGTKKIGCAIGAGSTPAARFAAACSPRPAPPPSPTRPGSRISPVSCWRTSARCARPSHGWRRRVPTCRAGSGPWARWPTWRPVAAALRPGEVLLEWAFLGEDLLGWAVTRNGLARFFSERVPVREFNLELRRYREACGRPDGDPAGSGEAIAARLLAPFAEPLARADRVLVVPHGAAHGIPFAALPFAGEPLGARRTVVHLPSASVLPFLGNGALPPGRVSALVVGNPSGELEHAEREACRVAALLGTPPLIGLAATKEAVRDGLRGKDVLHFATHARLDERAPLASGLELAFGEELSLHEWMGLRVDAALVVLSACETGRGEATGGDDVLGLARGILAAGARATVVSLWAVDDTATALVMSRFYQELRAGRGAGAALQAAQAWLRTADAREIARAPPNWKMLRWSPSRDRVRVRTRNGTRGTGRAGSQRYRGTTGIRITGPRSSPSAGESENSK
jgi:tetratricopeptide (TPR) repeat protein